ncbi:MAG: ABC-2 family transporter protein [Nitrospinae bacterium]|nr:ABC-2 family transporter protein [Nitrospinota bacterium]
MASALGGGMMVQLGIGLAGIGLVFYNTDSLGGWQPAELLVVLGVYTLIAGVARSFIQPNMYELMEGIYDGKLDYTLTKPVDSQLLVSITRFQPWRLVDVIVGLVVIGIALLRFLEKFRQRQQAERRVPRRAPVVAVLTVVEEPHEHGLGESMFWIHVEDRVEDFP